MDTSYIRMFTTIPIPIITALDVVVILYIAAIMNLALFHFHIIICTCGHTQCASSNKVCGHWADYNYCILSCVHTKYSSISKQWVPQKSSKLSL